MGGIGSKEDGEGESLEDSLPKLHSAWEREKRELQELPEKWSQIGSDCCARRNDQGSKIDNPWGTT